MGVFGSRLGWGDSIFGNIMGPGAGSPLATHVPCMGGAPAGVNTATRRATRVPAASPGFPIVAF
jgi:hypothetical protein